MSEQVDKKLVAVCGLFCPSCAIYIASNEDFNRLERQAKELHFTVEETRCEGCRSDKRNKNCDSCFMFTCSQKKGIDFCFECADFPCRELQDFQLQFPHRIELWKDLERIQSVGYEQFYKESIKNYSCSNCNTINTGWDVSCRKCGHEPSCNYVKHNIRKIEERLK